MKIFADPDCATYSHAGHPERPERILATMRYLQEQTLLPITWAKPSEAPLEALLRAHTPEHLARLREPEDFDSDTPYYPNIRDFAVKSAGAALDALTACLAGESVFSLMRPPGHHATGTRAMGFCYLSNVAIAALEALSRGCKSVAVLDFDVHHGNGTEAILVNQPGAWFASIHQHPCYPGTGTRNVGHNCYNFPVPPQTHRSEYRAILTSALEHLKQLRPSLLAISAGFDAFARDPLAQQMLEEEDFYWIGQSLRRCGIPVLSVLEGGYSHELPQLVFAYVRGLEGK